MAGGEEERDPVEVGTHSHRYCNQEDSSVK